MTLTYDITDAVLTDRYTAVVRGEMPRDEFAGWLAGTLHAVADYLEGVGVTATGPPFARFGRLGDLVVVEAGFPVPAEVPGDGLIEPSALPDGRAAVLHAGGYDGAERAYRAIMGWLDARGYLPAGPHWEVYESDGHTAVVVPYRRYVEGR